MTLSYKDIPNHFTFEEVYDQAVENAPQTATFVEVGTWLGASAVYLAQKIKQSGKNITFYAVDNFTAIGSMRELAKKAEELGGNFYHIFMENMKKYEVDDMVKAIVSDSTEAASQFQDSSVDFVYIDGAHDYRKVKSDILAWLPKMKKGGTMAGHDYDDNHIGVILAVNDVFSVFHCSKNSWIVYFD